MKKPRSIGRLSRRDFIGTISGATALTLLGLERSARGHATALAENNIGVANYDPNVARDFMARICYNENPIGPSPAAAEAIIDVAYLANRYPDWFGESLIADLASRYGLSSDRIICGSGATEMLRLCALAFSFPGGNVIVPNPSYSQFPTDCELFGRSVRYVGLNSQHEIDLDAIDNRVDGGTTAICLTNPNNPTGTLVDDGDLASFIQSLDNDIVVIVDEAYLEYIEESEYESVIELIRQGQNVVLVKTFSKVYGLAGARIGYAVSNSTNIQAMKRYQFISTISKSSLEAARAALNDQDHVDQTVELATQMKEYCFGHFQDMNLTYIPSRSSFFMVDVGDNAETVRALLAERQIYVRTGWGMSRHLRVSTGNPNEMDNFIRALREILSGLSRNGGRASLNSTQLFQATPNPFNSSTTIRIFVPRVGTTRLEVFDVQGRLVKRLVNGLMVPGEYAFTWNGDNENGSSVATGAYFYRLTFDQDVITRRMLLIK
jgi:histidinol-phosphate aminotransferase